MDWLDKFRIRARHSFVVVGIRTSELGWRLRSPFVQFASGAGVWQFEPWALITRIIGLDLAELRSQEPWIQFDVLIRNVTGPASPD